jgi:hypothetical protein
VRRDVLVEAGAFGGAPDDCAEDRDGEPLACETADDRLVGSGAERVAPLLQCGRELGRERLAARLPAFAAAHEQRGAFAVELEVGPVECEQLGAPQPGRDEQPEHELVTLDEAR